LKTLNAKKHTNKIYSWITSLLPEIGDLTNLRELYMYGNHLETLPTTIGHLTNLEELNLNENKLKRLPSEIVKLTHLRFLYLFNNRLIMMPNIGDLQDLELFD